MSAPVTLDAASVDAIAERVAELLRGERATPGELVDAVEIARRFSISRDTVYAKADELGAIRIGDGPRARLRFDPAKVADALIAHPATNPHSPKRTSRPRKPATVDLLPIRGEGS